MKVHTIEVTVEADGTATVKPRKLKVFREDAVNWKESAGKSLRLTFEDPQAFRNNEFAVTTAEGTCLIANKKGRHPYKVSALDPDFTIKEDPPPMPIIIIMDPSDPDPDPDSDSDSD